MVAIMRHPSTLLTTSPALTPMAWNQFATVMTSEMRITRLLARGRDLGFPLLLPGRAFFFRGRRPWRRSWSLVSANSGCRMTRRFFFFGRLPHRQFRPAAAGAGA